MLIKVLQVTATNAIVHADIAQVSCAPLEVKIVPRVIKNIVPNETARFEETEKKSFEERAATIFTPGALNMNHWVK